jgi:hypothetical protein
MFKKISDFWQSIKIAQRIARIKNVIKEGKDVAAVVDKVRPVLALHAPEAAKEVEEFLKAVKELFK